MTKMKDYRYIWDYDTDFEELEKSMNLKKIIKINEKINFTKNRIKKFKKWLPEFSYKLLKLKEAALNKLTKQLEFLQYVKEYKSNNFERTISKNSLT